jgi:hypothetical protein
LNVTDAESKPVAQSTPDPAPSVSPVAPPSWGHRLGEQLLRRLLIVGALWVLVMIGLFLTNVSHLHARYYWSAMFPVFGILSLWHELKRLRSDPAPVWKLVLVQALHWLGPIVAVQIIFLQLARGQMDADAVALVTLVILAVTCFLAGVHMDHAFYWVSVALVFAAVIGTEVEAYIWALLAIAIVALAVAVFAATALRRRTETARAGS